MQPNSLPKPVFRRVADNLYRLEPSGVYYAIFKRKGNQIKRSLKTTDRALANFRVKEAREEADSLVSHDADKLTFDVVAERWQASEQHALKEKTATRRQCYVAALKPFFRGLTLRSITRAHCESWLTDRGASIASETFNHELGVMKAIFNYAKEQGWILRSPALSIKRRRNYTAEVVVPTRAQFQEIVAAIRRSDGRTASQESAKDGADLIELLAYSGCRVEEARQLKWEHVAWPCAERQGTLRVTGGKRRTKNGESRTLPMVDSLLALLTRLREEQKPSPTDSIVKIASARKCFSTACKKLEFPHFTHHDLRHFFVTSCIESGVDIPTISKWAGHKDGGALAMKRYGHLREEHSYAQAKRVSFAPAPNVVSLNHPGTETGTSPTDATDAANIPSPAFATAPVAA